MTSADKPWHKDPECTICFCHAVLFSEIVKAIRNGSKTLEKIQDETQASTGCGGCEFDVREILKEELERN